MCIPAQRLHAEPSWQALGSQEGPQTNGGGGHSRRLVSSDAAPTLALAGLAAAGFFTAGLAAGLAAAFLAEACTRRCARRAGNTDLGCQGCKICMPRAAI